MRLKGMSRGITPDRAIGVKTPCDFGLLPPLRRQSPKTRDACFLTGPRVYVEARILCRPSFRSSNIHSRKWRHSTYSGLRVEDRIKMTQMRRDVPVNSKHESQ